MINTKHKVVFQLNTEDILEKKAMITYVTNVKKHWGSDVQIHVVVHGPGIGMLLKSKSTMVEAIQGLIKQDVIFMACQNTLSARKIPSDDLLDNVLLVPSAIVDIIEKQEQGWAYIKCNL